MVSGMGGALFLPRDIQFSRMTFSSARIYSFSANKRSISLYSISPSRSAQPWYTSSSNASFSVSAKSANSSPARSSSAFERAFLLLEVLLRFAFNVSFWLSLASRLLVAASFCLLCSGYLASSRFFFMSIVFVRPGWILAGASSSASSSFCSSTDVRVFFRLPPDFMMESDEEDSEGSDFLRLLFF